MSPAFPAIRNEDNSTTTIKEKDLNYNFTQKEDQGSCEDEDPNQLQIPIPRGTERRRSCYQVATDQKNQYFAAVATNLLALGFGTMFGWSGTAWPGIKESTQIGEPTADEESWIGSIIILGALLSGFVSGGLIEKFGRRNVMLALTLPCLLGWGTIYFAQNFTMIYIGRLLTGFAGGASAVVVPIYIGETADPDIRGTLLAGFDFGIAGGFLYIAVIGYFLSWKMQVVACAMIAVVGHALIMLIPESPRYLISKGDTAGAMDSLAWLHRVTPFSPVLNSYMNELVDVATQRSQKKTKGFLQKWNRLFNLEILKPCSVALMIHLLSSFSAEIPISAYTVGIFNSTATDLNAYHATMIFGGVDAISAVLAALIVDRFGRRPLLLFSQFTMGLALGSTGLFFWLKEENNGITLDGLDWLPVTSLGVFVFAFSIGTGPVSYMITGEILPPEAKGLAAGLINAMKWLSGFVVTRYFLVITELLGDSIGYWIFAGICILGGIYVMFCVPETKGKSLEEIQLEYARKDDETSLNKSNA